MKKNQKNILIILLLIIIFFIGAFYYRNFLKFENKIIKDDNKIETSKENIVTLFVLGKIYKVSVKDGDTVYDAMNMLESNKENNFTFQFKDYPSMGIFIEGINGIKGEKNKYWIYSVNKVEASISVSKYILKNGDSILWEQKTF